MASSFDQSGWTEDHGIKPETIKKAIRAGIESEVKARRTVSQAIHATEENVDQAEIIKLLEEEMLEAAKNLEFERAAQLRDKINELKGMPVIKSGNAWSPEGEGQQQKIWQPKTPPRGRKRVAK